MKNKYLDYGLISDGCTSVTRSSCLAWSLNELSLTPEDQTQVSRAMHDEDLSDNADPEELLTQRYDDYLTMMVNVAQRYLRSDAQLVLRYNGPDEDDWFGVEKKR